jgi:hypothetical protein
VAAANRYSTGWVGPIRWQMVKLTIKLAIVALIANALYQVVPPYYANLQFTEAMKELAAYPGWRETVPTLKLKSAKIAKEHGIELGPEDFDIKMVGSGTNQTAIIDVSYTVVMKPIPGRVQTHVYTVHAEADTPRFGSLTP